MICEPLCRVDIYGLVEWISGISRDFWPDWNKPSLRPAVVADGGWESMTLATAPVISEVMGVFPDHLKPGNPMITTVHPGDFVPYHTDTTDPGWVTRVHVPIVTNKDAVVIMDDIEQHLRSGIAYKFDIRKPHAIANRGEKSRIHLMFDVHD